MNKLEQSKLKAIESLSAIPLPYRGRYVNLILYVDQAIKHAEEAKYSLLHFKHMESDEKHIQYAIDQLESIFNDGKR